jgi:hypothetical protein
MFEHYILLSDLAFQLIPRYLSFFFFFFAVNPEEVVLAAHSDALASSDSSLRRQSD